MLHLVFWIFVLLLAFSFFGISVQSIISSPAGQENFAYAWHLLVLGYDWVVNFISAYASR